MNTRLFGCLVLLVLFVLSVRASADSQMVFTITEVGASNNSGTIFINTVEYAADAECSTKNQFKIPLTDPLADRFLSIALTARASNSKVAIYYLPEECVGSGIRPNVILLK